MLPDHKLLQHMQAVWLRYGFAIASALLLIWLRYLLDPALEDRQPFTFSLLAVVIAAWFGGLGPAMLALVLGGFLSAFLFVPPVNTIGFTSTADVIAWLIYLIVGTSSALISESLRRARLKAEANYAKLQEETRIRQQAAQALRQSESRFQNLAETSPLLIWATDVGGELVYANQSWLKYIGRNFETSLGARWFDYLHPDDMPTFTQKYQAAIEGRLELLEEVCLLQHDNAYRHMLCKAAPRIDADGQFEGYIHFCIDISERKQAEAAFLASEERFRRTFEQAAIGIAHVDMNQQFQMVNQHLCLMLGYSREELLKCKFPEITPLSPEDTLVNNLLNWKHQSDRAELPLRHKDGHTLWANVNLSLVRHDDGSTLDYFILIMEDITERKRTRQELQDYRDRLRLALNVGQVGTWRLDFISGMDTRDTNLNILLGLNDRESTQEIGNFMNRLHPDDRPRVQATLDKAQAECGEYAEEFRVLHPRLGVRWLRDRGAAICGENGVAVAMTGALIDITERKRTEENQRFLAEAGTRLAASLDYESIVATIADLIVPARADWCTIDRVDEDGSLHPVVLTHIDPEKALRLRRLREEYFELHGAPRSEAEVARTGQIRFVPHITSENLIQTAPTPTILTLLQELRPRATIFVPLQLRGRVVGVLNMTLNDSGRVYTQDDVALAEELARQIAVALDNARLYQQVQAEQERYEVTLSSIGDAVIATDTEGAITFMNRVAQDLTRWPLELARGRHLHEIFVIHNEYTGEPVESPFDKVVRTGGIVGLANHTLLTTRDGRQIPIDDSGAPIKDGRGQMQGVVLVFRDITERHVAEAALQASEARFRGTFENAAVGIALVTLDGHWMRVNDRMTAILGYSVAELTGGMTFQDVTHPDDLATDEAQAARLVAGDIPWYSMEKRYIRKDGLDIWVRITTSLQRDRDGQPQYFIGLVEDIHARKQIERALQASEARFRSTFENAAVGICHADTDGNWLLFNGRMCEIVGYTEEELRGVPFAALTHPDDLAPEGELYQRLVAGDIPSYAMEKRYIAKDGGIVWVNVTVSAKRDDAGNIEYLIGVVEDIGWRKRIEAELSASEARFRTLAENASDMVYEYRLQPTLGYSYVSPSSAALTGYPPEAYYADPTFDVSIMHPDDRERFQELLANLVARAAQPYLGRVYHRAGRLVWLEHRYEVQTDAAGQVVSVQGIARDVTERVEAQERTQLLSEVTAALSSAATPEEVAEAVVTRALTALNASAGMVSIVTEDGTGLRSLNAVGVPPLILSETPVMGLDVRSPMTDAARTGEAVWLESAADYAAAYPDFYAWMHPHTGTQALAALPLRAGERVIAAMNISFQAPRRFTPQDRLFLEAVAEQCAQALDRASLYRAEQHARSAAEGARWRAQLLAEAGATLNASLDYERTLQRVAEVAVPDFADWCAFNLIFDDNPRDVRMAAVAHIDPAKVQWAWELQNRAPYDPDAPGGVPKVIATQQPEYIPYIPDEMLVAAAQTEDDLALLREIGFRSVMMVPLSIRGRVLGALQFVSTRDDRLFSEDDLALAQEIAGRAATAIDNARHYRDALERRARLQVTLNSIGDAVIATNGEGRITFMNPVAEALTGWAEQDAIELPIEQVLVLFNEDSREIMPSPVGRILQEGETISLESGAMLVARDGHEIPIDDSAAPIRGEDGALLGAILVFRDMTERRAIERAEREQRSMSEALRDTAMALNSTLNVSDVLDSILANVGRVVPHDAANIMFIEDGVATIARRRSNAPGTEEDASILPPRIRIMETHTFKQMMETAEPLIISDARTHPNWMAMEGYDDWIRGYLGVPIQSQSGDIIGFLNLGSMTPGFFQAEQADLLKVFTSQAALAINNARLYEQAQELAILEERHRLGRELHDAVSQSLFSATLIAEALPRLAKINPDRVWPQLDQLHRLTRTALAEMRVLLVEFRPETLYDADISTLLKQLSQAIGDRTGLQILLDLNIQLPIPRKEKFIIYRIVQESLNNAVKHARASEMLIRLNVHEGGIELSIRDDGVGFDPAQHSAGMGLSIMRERARSIGALLTFNSIPGEGTEIHLLARMEEDDEDDGEFM